MELVLPDTNVWIEHVRGTARSCRLDDLLNKERAISHSWVLGELILGNLGPRKKEIRFYLSLLPAAKEYPTGEVIQFIEQESLSGRGLSLIDAQLLYGAVKDRYLLWTFDKALRKSAEKYDRAYSP